ncbi:MAG: TIGR02300 family protein [Hyphomicrobiaceae bacterium]
MSMKAERGTKRTCQSASCGARFYDLNRDPIVCPICGTIYEMMTTTAIGAVAAATAEKPRRPAKKAEFEGVAPDEVPDVEADDALADIDADEEALTDDETFLEAEEEDGGDVSGIIGGTVPEGEEEP